jgi:hypothetical protein
MGFLYDDEDDDDNRTIIHFDKENPTVDERIVVESVDRKCYF